MTHDDMIAVIQAHKDGKPIEWRRLPGTPDYGTPKDWGRFAKDAIAWEFSTHEYRIKPEERKPREWIALLGSDGCLGFGAPPEQAVFPKPGPYLIGNATIVRVREVLE